MLIKRITAIILLILAITAGIPSAAGAGVVPYDTYIYDFWESIVFTPAAYVPGENISGVTLGIGAFRDPQGMFVAQDGAVYICDTGNNRIVILEPDLKTVRDVIEEFSNNGRTDSFNRPRGVAVSSEGHLYVADTENRRVIALDGHDLIRTIQNPRSDLLDDNFDFVPLKVTVDYAGRVFVIARNMFQGIMTFNTDGDFIGFYGTINVQITMWQRMWRALSTQEQRSRQRLFIPTEFTGLDVDPAGFVYASNKDGEGEQAVRRLNPNGVDVIRRGTDQNLGGDILTFGASGSAYSGPSLIIDVTYRGNGIYSLLDARRGRIFTYDHEGNLLYIFGGMGEQAGTFIQPTAVAAQESRILALDARRNELITFEETRYGALINQAVSLRYDGDEAKAVETWREVLQLNENLELANAGIGKAYLTAGDNRAAMRYLELGMDKAHYAIAFKRHRNDVLKDNINWMLTALILVIVGYIALRAVIRRKKGQIKEEGLLDG